MIKKLHPQFHIVLPENTPPDQVEQHIRARMAQRLSQRFEIAMVRSVKTGKLMTKNGPVYGEQFLVVLSPIDEPIESERDEDCGEVVFEHPDYKKLIH